MKSDGKKDGDQMKITKARLVEIIKEEVAGLDEGTFGGLFSKAPKGSERPGRRPKGEQSPEEARGEVEARRGEIGSAVDALPRRQQMIANAAVVDANLHSDEKDAEQDQAMQSIISRFDTGEVGDSLLGDKKFVNQMRSKVASGDLFKTTFLPRILKAIDDKINSEQNKEFFDDALIDFLDDPATINKIANKINQIKHKPGE